MLSWIFFRCCADPPAIFYVKERSDLRLIFNRPFWNIPYITLLQLHFGIVGCQNYPGFLLDFFKNETSLQPFHSTWHVGIMFHTALGFYERRTGLKKTCPTEILFWRMGPPLGRISAQLREEYVPFIDQSYLCHLLTSVINHFLNMMILQVLLLFFPLSFQPLLAFRFFVDLFSELGQSKLNVKIHLFSSPHPAHHNGYTVQNIPTQFSVGEQKTLTTYETSNYSCFFFNVTFNIYLGSCFSP